jgi:hypothetical protein
MAVKGEGEASAVPLWAKRRRTSSTDTAGRSGGRSEAIMLELPPHPLDGDPLPLFGVWKIWFPSLETDPASNMAILLESVLLMRDDATTVVPWCALMLYSRGEVSWRLGDKGDRRGPMPRAPSRESLPCSDAPVVAGWRPDRGTGVPVLLLNGLVAPELGMASLGAWRRGSSSSASDPREEESPSLSLRHGSKVRSPRDLAPTASGVTEVLLLRDARPP